jgi:signal transduction histidine kinase
VSALGAVSASLRQSVIAGEILTESDVVPLEASVEQMLTSLRGMLQHMSQPPLEGQGLRSALVDLVTSRQVRGQGTRIVLHADAAEGLPNDECALCIYRIVQECLINIARHAPASASAHVQVRRESHRLCVQVSNDLAGVGSPRAPGSGMGLKLLGERVRSLSGSFAVEVSATQFAVRAELPMAAP